ncbi:glutathione transferase GstA [Aureimonas phyllosphaerae]|uniref:Glutathione S-transferase n=1 Tax=Aureimonas phyllosphaerae TaxID=1166078 RepID=A0A7W6BWI9_9HYPH|nr:glutathione transferase GstA [Aureimonas phyllosphaerae]MBB3937655.1 glutathione S-transferase [Aureimonas phyllosphaerae]MBB3961545.1 glutathione S-transferase [Aureimonas phyllosphaerae]SFF55443.1 glutathione S-transferase [Aureimonas phyllosphaerae]
MKLYYKPGACSLAPHIVAREADLPVELVSVDLVQKKLEDGGDYFAVNPNGYVPALDIGEGPVLTEASVVVQYLADRKPESGLMPAAGSTARYRVQQWLAFVSTELHKQFSPLFKPNTPDATKEIQKELLAKRFGFVDQALEGKTYLTGETFTAADAYLFTVLNWASFVKLDLTAFPEIARFMAAVRARPAVQTALREEGLA